MRGKVIVRFHDKHNWNIHEVGTIVDFDEKRMEDLIERKLCEKIEGQKDETSAPKSKDKENKSPRKRVLVADADKETPTPVIEPEKENDVELDEKAKSEQEAAKKIAEATKKSSKK